MSDPVEFSQKSPRVARNKGKLIGPKPPLKPKHVWSIRTRLQLEGRMRDLAMFNLAIDSKLRGCDVVALKVEDVAPHGYSADRATVRQRKTGRPVRFELTEQTRQAIDDYIRAANKKSGEHLFVGRRGGGQCMTTRQFARLVGEWIGSIGLDPLKFGTHSLRRTKATCVQCNFCLGTRRWSPRYVTSASRSMTPWRLPNKLMSEAPGAGLFALPRRSISSWVERVC